MPPSWRAPEVTLAPPLREGDLELAAHFGVQVATERDPTVWQLTRTAHRMKLCSPAGPEAMAIELDLRSGPLARRLRSSRRDEPLPRAIGLTRGQVSLTVVDATAGLCRDAMVLAHLGCRVTAIERIPALAFLAHDAASISAFAGHLEVLATDSTAWLGILSGAAAPEVVYLDPMFATAGRAQVKKEMQVCRALAGAAEDTAALFAAARAVARERVVVKRHHDLPPLADGVAFSVAGERVRFDVYLSPTDPARRP
ncbi:MAG: class I SAM-dependent methyltransferase [Planctomycetota bacterium]